MTLKNIIQKRLLVLIGLVLAAVLIIALVLSSDAAGSAEEAVRDGDDTMVLAPVYEMNDRALFFFIRGEESFGAVSATHSWFGWRLETRSESTVPEQVEPGRIDSYMSDGDGFVYGLFDVAEGYTVQVGGTPADQLPLDLRFPQDLLVKSGLTGKAVWFTENAPPERPLPLQLLDEDGQELHRLEMY